jgi:hypothetical protein
VSVLGAGFIREVQYLTLLTSESWSSSMIFFNFKDGLFLNGLQSPLFRTYDSLDYSLMSCLECWLLLTLFRSSLFLKTRLSLELVDLHSWLQIFRVKLVSTFSMFFWCRLLLEIWFSRGQMRLTMSGTTCTTVWHKKKNIECNKRDILISD